MNKLGPKKGQRKIPREGFLELRMREEPLRQRREGKSDSSEAEKGMGLSRI